MKSYYRVILIVAVLALVLFLFNLSQSNVTSQAVKDKNFIITSVATEKVRFCGSWQDNYDPYLEGYSSVLYNNRIESGFTNANDFCLSTTTLKETSCDSDRVLRTTIGECRYGCVNDINGRGYCNKPLKRT